MKQAGLWVGAVLLGSIVSANATAETPKVLASIRPVFALAETVMAGVGEPGFLVPGGLSPHSYALRPSDAERLAHADVVIWVGEHLENFLKRPLDGLPRSATILTLTEIPGTTLRKSRVDGNWEKHAHSDRHDDRGDDHEHDQEYEHETDHMRGGALDPHLWLDVDNARVWALAIARTLAKKDPGNAGVYEENARRFGDRMNRLDTEIDRILAPVRGQPFAVFHDAYQYFEARYGLHAVGSVTLGPERQPSVRRLATLRERLTSLGARCVFVEPQFPPKLARTVVDGTPLRTGTLDPLGADIPNGPGYYETLLRRMAESLKSCLE